MNIDINLNDPDSLQQIHSILEEFQNSVLNVNGENNRYSIEFEFMLDDNLHEQIDNLPNYFKNCNHINEIIGYPIYIKKKDEILNNQTECIICTDCYKYKEYKRILHCCKSIYHKKCIDKWFKKNSSCPNCRHDFLEVKKND
jgi:hypothetical protein